MATSTRTEPSPQRRTQITLKKRSGQVVGVTELDPQYRQVNNGLSIVKREIQRAEVVEGLNRYADRHAPSTHRARNAFNFSRQTPYDIEIDETLEEPMLGMAGKGCISVQSAVCPRSSTTHQDLTSQWVPWLTRLLTGCRRPCSHTQ